MPHKLVQCGYDQVFVTFCRFCLNVRKIPLLPNTTTANFRPLKKNAIAQQLAAVDVCTIKHDVSYTGQ